MSERNVEGVSVSGAELVDLELLRCRTAGAAHSLNNLFTSLLGELALLGDERKGDAVVSDAVDALREQLERCVRIVRNGLGRSRPGPGGEGEVDLGLLLSRCGRILEGTLPRRILLGWQVPDQSWVVRGDRDDLELLVLALTFRLGQLVGGGAMSLTISLADDVDPEKLALRLEVESADLPNDARQRLVDPRLADTPTAAAALSALHAIADAHDTHLQTERTGPDSLRLSLVFDRLDV